MENGGLLFGYRPAVLTFKIICHCYMCGFMCVCIYVWQACHYGGEKLQDDPLMLSVSRSIYHTELVSNKIRDRENRFILRGNANGDVFIVYVRQMKI